MRNHHEESTGPVVGYMSDRTERCRDSASAERDLLQLRRNFTSYVQVEHCRRVDYQERGQRGGEVSVRLPAG